MKHFLSIPVHLELGVGEVLEQFFDECFGIIMLKILPIIPWSLTLNYFSCMHLISALIWIQYDSDLMMRKLLDEITIKQHVSENSNLLMLSDLVIPKLCKARIPLTSFPIEIETEW